MASRSRSPVAHAVDVLAGDQHPARRRPVAAGDELEQRRLARPVRPHDADDRRRGDREIGVQRERQLRAEHGRACSACAPARRASSGVGIAQAPSSRARSRASSRSAPAGPSWTMTPPFITYDAVGDRQRALDVLLDDQHRDPLAAEPKDRAHHVLDDPRGEPLAGLVEQHQARRAEQGAGDRHHLHLAAGEVLRLAVHEVRQRAEDLAALGDAPGAEARRLPRDREVALDGERRKDAPVVRDPADPAPGDLVGRPRA